MTLRNLLTAWSRLLLASLADAGVTDVVLSPGSRSTPFMVAAEMEGRLRTHDSIDERAAAFFALGQARVTGRPSVVICTSGTAAAHYLPAVVEANLDHVPLVLLTSDRPLEMQDSGAAQTIDQIKLMGDQVRRFYELGTPDAAPSALAGVRRLAAQAAFWSTGPDPGPVHINARARKPLEPVAAESAAEVELDRLVADLLARPLVRAAAGRPSPDPALVAEVAELCRSAVRGVIVAGPAPVGSWPAPASVEELAVRTGYPLWSEATSQLRLNGEVPEVGGAVRVDGFDALLRSARVRSALAPEVILQLGHTPTSTGFEQLCSATDACFAHVVVDARSWVDPHSTATHLVLSEPAAFVDALIEALGDFERGATGWTQAWREADDLAWSVLDDAVAEPGGDDGVGLSEAALARTLLAGLPTGSLLMLGNSLPIRNVDTWCRSGAADVSVLSQRGANGIDGLVAGAAGSATIRGPVTLLLGDVSLVHDLTGLAVARVVGDGPLVVVVANNGGGRIFETLPIARSGLGREVVDHVTTPHDIDFAHAAALFGHRYEAVASADELAAALARAYATAGCTVIEAAVPTDGGAAMHAGALAAIDELVGGRDWGRDGGRDRGQSLEGDAR